MKAHLGPTGLCSEDTLHLLQIIVPHWRWEGRSGYCWREGASASPIMASFRLKGEEEEERVKGEGGQRCRPAACVCEARLYGLVSPVPSN